MSLDLLLALAGFAFVTSATPGPNNMMLMASGANFGIRRTVPHMLGVSLGFGLMVVVLGFGVDRLIAQSTMLATMLKWVSMAYMLWLAWKIATALPPEMGTPDTNRVPLTFLQAAAFQWVNPKAWAMALGALSAFAAGLGGALIVGLVFAAVNLPTVSAWVALGQGMRSVLSTPARFKSFNLVMAALLIVSMMPVLLD
ncbi:LysE family translocator [Paracoccus sp. Z330]|uniref:LysE family translocator n=1 Tax=Paracoccus onchidii TaxID=3017813 RepID=A0ABT4ZJE7_9RHOB|nr:LysE family translocator [Paracoccus onchidii]MDB6179412.1 LysE family translocator [Paracoccus onchidii]